MAKPSRPGDQCHAGHGADPTHRRGGRARARNSGHDPGWTPADPIDGITGTIPNRDGSGTRSPPIVCRADTAGTPAEVMSPPSTARPGTIKPIESGYYRFTFRRTDGAWRIRH